MYGSTTGEEKEAGQSEQFPLVKRDGEAIVDIDERVRRFLKNPFDEDFDDPEFWNKVKLIILVVNLNFFSIYYCSFIYQMLK